jgi:uncharacterized protein YjbJ (UPF0337 family)
MTGNADQIKGRTKEAVGDLTGNKDLRSEGTTDRRAGEVKNVVDKAGRKIDDVVDKATSVLHPK